MSFFALYQRAFAVLALLALIFPFVPVRAEVSTTLWRGYGASLVGGVESPSVMRVGDTQTVRLRVRNTGTTTWSSSGGAYVSLYHWNPLRKVETASSLADTSWITNFQVARLPVPELRPGEEASLAFRVRAPSIPGAYSGEFILAAEDVAWLHGSRFRLDIRVEGAQTSTPTTGATTAPSSGTATPSVSVPASEPAIPLALDASGRFRARIMNAGGTAWALESGQDVSVRMAFQNTGEIPWLVSGATAVRLVTIDEKNALRASVFAHPRWASASVIAPLATHTSLGSEASWSFTARAPEQAGVYRERFALATVGGALIPGSIVETDITVAASSGFVATDVSDLNQQPVVQAPEDSLPAVPRPLQDGRLITVGQISTPLEYELPGNGRQQLSIGWKNTGTEAWSRMGMRLVESTPWVKASWLADPTWSDNRPPEASVIARPNDTAYYTFFVKAPPKRGSYQLRFRLFANGQPVDGGELLVMVRVTSDGYIAPDQVRPPTPTPVPTPSTPSTPTLPPLQAQPLGGDSSQLPSEPMIRAGLYQPPHEALQVQTLTAGATVFSGQTAVCALATGQSVRITYLRGTGQYSLTGDGGCSGVASSPYRVRSNDGIAPLRIADFVRPAHWISNASDRDFRGQLELRVSNTGSEVWVINELPIEWYLKGIAETSNISPTEFQRTLLVAARTYAMYHVQRETKHAAKGFTVEATHDQVYRGYAMELRAPRIGQAVDATRGQIVTYQGRLAITPYFSRSDGRTRSWGEVWAGGSNYPWLVGVPVPQDQGRTLWGHGVGMSATGALSMANEGRTYNDILTYFYTGIQVMQVYR